MNDWSLGAVEDPVVLCLGAHCDDIEIGCGGTLIELGKSIPRATLHCVIFASNERREAETRAAVAELASNWSSVVVDVHRFRNGYFPYVGADIKDVFERLKSALSPDLIFTHCRDDRHQDHRVISDLTYNTFRDHSVLEYEIAKFDGDLGRPNAYVEISSDAASEKVECLLRNFGSQLERLWFKRETFQALMQLRSIECNAQSGFAEAFYSRKMKLNSGLFR